MEVNYVCSCQAVTEHHPFFKMRSATCKDFSLLCSQINNQAARNNTPIVKFNLGTALTVTKTWLKDRLISVTNGPGFQLLPQNQ